MNKVNFTCITSREGFTKNKIYSAKRVGPNYIITDDNNKEQSFEDGSDMRWYFKSVIS